MTPCLSARARKRNCGSDRVLTPCSGSPQVDAEAGSLSQERIEELQQQLEDLQAHSANQVRSVVAVCAIACGELGWQVAEWLI